MNRNTGRPVRRVPQKPEPRARRALLWSAIVAMAIGCAATEFWFERGTRAADTPQRPEQPQATSHCVGGSACVSCHTSQAAEWRTSQHHDAMAEATGQNVLANFNNATFTYAGTTSTFFK